MKFLVNTLSLLVKPKTTTCWTCRGKFDSSRMITGVHGNFCTELHRDTFWSGDHA
jgi:hypothetical protein